MNDIRPVCTVITTCHMVYDGKTRIAWYSMLEVNMMEMALTLMCSQISVDIILDTDYQVCTFYRMFSFGYGKEVIICQPFKHSIPLFRILLILKIKLHNSKTITPFACINPFLSFLN